MKKINLSLIASAIITSSVYANLNEAKITISSATKSEQSIQDVTSNVEVITGAELQSKHITTVIDALKLANISVNQSGGIGQTSSFFMQGMSAEHTLVLVDGIRYNDPTITNGYALLDNLMVHNIDRIEIIKGAQSGIWGADAAAGVINIITKQANNKQNVLINAEAGSFNTKKLNFKLQGKDERSNVSMGFSKIKSDGFTAITPKGDNIDDYEDDKYENTTIGFKYGFKINDTNKIDFSHTIIDASGDYDTSGNDKNSNFTNKNEFTSLNFNHIDSFNTVDIYANKSTFNRTLVSGIYEGEYIGETKEFGLKSKIPYRTNDFIIVGADAKEQIMEKSYSVLKGKYKSKAFFVTNSNHFSNTIVTQSIRHDDYSKFKDKTTGKIGAKQIINKDLSLSANYGTAYKTPSPYNLYAGFGSGNLDLVPEDIKSLDVTIKYKKFAINYFNSKIDNEIFYDNSTFSYKQTNKQSKYKGYEVSYKKTFNTTLLNLKYMNQTAKDKDGKDLQRREKEKVNFGITYFGIKKLDINLDAQYVGSRFDDLAQTKQTGKYTVLNTVLNYKINKNFKTYLKIDNLTDKYYQTVDGYASSPRAYYAGVNVSF
jgi:vitamin B12 transporter